MSKDKVMVKVKCPVVKCPVFLGGDTCPLDIKHCNKDKVITAELEEMPEGWVRKDEIRNEIMGEALKVMNKYGELHLRGLERVLGKAFAEGDKNEPL